MLGTTTTSRYTFEVSVIRARRPAAVSTYPGNRQWSSYGGSPLTACTQTAVQGIDRWPMMVSIEARPENGIDRYRRYWIGRSGTTTSIPGARMAGTPPGMMRTPSIGARSRPRRLRSCASSLASMLLTAAPATRNRRISGEILERPSSSPAETSVPARTAETKASAGFGRTWTAELSRETPSSTYRTRRSTRRTTAPESGVPDAPVVGGRVGALDRWVPVQAARTRSSSARALVLLRITLLAPEPLRQWSDRRALPASSDRIRPPRGASRGAGLGRPRRRQP